MKLNSAILLAMITIIVFSCRNQYTNEPANLLRGMWKLDKFESYDTISGKWSAERSRAGSSGYILYDGMGHMAVHLLPGGYGEIDTFTNPDSLSYEQLKVFNKTLKGNYVYFATYRVEKGQVLHSKLSATNPKDIGTVAIRNFQFNGDTLILAPKEKINGTILRLKWIRM